MNKKIRSLSISALIILLTGCQLLPFGNAASTTETQSTVENTPVAIQTEPVENYIPLDGSVLASVQQTFQQIYQNVNPSVVNIQVTTLDTWYTSSAQGSGFVWDAEGHIVTNNHVVENASQITVVFSDGTSVDAQLVGTDPQSDLAVIKVDSTASPLESVRMGDSKSVQVGDLVIAIGNPYGLSGTMTQGIVSALSRSLTVDNSDQFSYSTYTIPDIIQTDAAINPGNSGGVLVNVDGEVIGVTSAIKSSTSSNAGIGFVIPSHIVARVVPELIATGSYAHPDLGFDGVTLTPNINEMVELASNQSGILITGLNKNGPAEKAGLKATTRLIGRQGQTSIVLGDVIVAVDGKGITTYEALISYIFNQTNPGQTISITILREGSEKTIDLTLGASK